MFVGLKVVKHVKTKMKGVKVFEIVFILLFTLFSLLILVNFLAEKLLKVEENRLTIYSKEDLKLKIKNLILKCFNKFKKENRNIICYEIIYLGNEEIDINEIKSAIYDFKLNVLIEFDKLVKNESLLIIYSINEIKLLKTNNLVISV